MLTLAAAWFATPQASRFQIDRPHDSPFQIPDFKIDRTHGFQISRFAHPQVSRFQIDSPSGFQIPDLHAPRFPDCRFPDLQALRFPDSRFPDLHAPSV